MPRSVLFPSRFARRVRLATFLPLLLASFVLLSVGGAQAQKVIATVAVGYNPQSIAVNSTTNKIYVASPSNDTEPASQNVTVIDGATNATTTISSSDSPWAIAVNPVTNEIYVSNNESPATVTVINGATNAATDITVPSNTTGSSGLAVNPVTNKIYVVNGDSDNVTVINGATLATTTVPTGTTPNAIAVNTVTNKIYVLNLGGSVTVINGADNSFATVSVGSLPEAIAVNPVTNKIYVVDATIAVDTATDPITLGYAVTVIDGATNDTTKINLGMNLPTAVAVDSVSNKIYYTNEFDTPATVTVLDGATNTFTIVNADQKPNFVAVDSVANQIYVTNTTSNDVTVINGATNAATNIDVGGNPVSVVVNPVTHRAYVLNQNDGTVSVIAGVGPTAIATTTTLTADVNPQQAGSKVTFTAHVAPASGTAVAAGNLTFSVDGVNQSPEPLDSTGHAVYVTSGLAVGAHTIKASFAGDAAFGASSASMTETITADLPVTATPVFSLKAGSYTTTQWVTLTDSTSGAAVYYTTNGSTPTTASTKYTGPITVSFTETLKAVAVAAGHSASVPATEAYSITPPAWAPTFSLAAGTYKGAQTVRLGDTTPGAVIYYTTNGATPTTSSAIYSGPITVSATATIKAYVTASGYAPSAVASAVYTITQ